MDKTVTAKFYQIRAGRGAGGPLTDHLRTIEACPLDDRIRIISDLPMWIDKIEIDRRYVSGRFCRKQSTNLSPRALHNAALVPLGVPEIGQTVAWRYDSEFSVMAIESSRTGLSLSRFLSYIREFCDCRGYAPMPVTTDANLELARSGRIRQLAFQLATPRDLRQVAPYQQSVSEGMNMLMSEELGTLLEVRFSLRVGEPDIPYSRLERIARWLRGEHKNNRGDIKKLQVRIIDAEGDQEDLDLLDVHLKDQRDLDLPDDDPDASYTVRYGFLRSAFQRHRSTLSQQFGHDP